MNIYLKQIYNNTRHKYYVMKECWHQGLYILSITHDLNKYIPWVLKAYADYAKGDYNKGRNKSGYYRPYTDDPAFNLALHYHVTHSKHHWQYWSIQVDAEGGIPVDIPDKYLKEMLCDWIGASIASGRGSGGAKTWYIENGIKLLLSDTTRKYITRFFNIEEAN
jgi:hypothetical protein